MLCASGPNASPLASATSTYPAPTAMASRPCIYAIRISVVLSHQLGGEHAGKCGLQFGGRIIRDVGRSKRDVAVRPNQYCPGRPCLSVLQPSCTHVDVVTAEHPDGACQKRKVVVRRDFLGRSHPRCAVFTGEQDEASPANQVAQGYAVALTFNPCVRHRMP